MFNDNKVSRSVRWALVMGVAGVSCSMPLYAQQAAEANDEVVEERFERVQVTGSRIRRTDTETASPVHVVTAEDIRATGFTRIEDLMATLPQLEMAGQSSFLANATGVANLDLRGMGVNRTLVLVNGRRLQPGGAQSQAPDVNQIPIALVERVEVMTGGGSSVYGADAVAGVVNFVMRSNFEGLEVSAGVAGYQHSNGHSYMRELQDTAGYEYPTGSGFDGETFTIDLVGGSTFANGKGHASVYATWRKNEEVLQADRDYSSCALNNSGTACGGSATAENPNFYFMPLQNGDPDYDREVYWALTPENQFSPDATSLYNYAPANHFMRPNERYTFGSFLEYEVNQHFRPYVETNYMHDRTVGQRGESGIFFEGFEFDINSDVFTDAQRAQLQEQFPGEDLVYAEIGKRNVEGGPRRNSLDHNSYRIVVGADGLINDMWEYDVSFQYGTTSSIRVAENDLFVPSLAQVLRAEGAEVCGEDCIPYEIFTYNGVTPEAAGGLGGVAMLTGYTRQRIVNGFISGEMDWGLPSSSYNISAVIGLENREVDFESIADEVYQQSLLTSMGGPIDSLRGGYNVREVFSELSIPVLEDAVAVDRLAIDLGLRYSDYNTTGSESTYKVGVDWTINPDYKIRGSYNRAVRAPNVEELFSVQSQGLWVGNDNCAGETPQFTLEQCINTGMTEAQYGNATTSPANQYNGIFGGNPGLNPEIADTYTLGLVANPFDRFNFTVDYWDIKLESSIGNTNPELTIDQCALTGNDQFCDRIQRGPAGDLWRGNESYVIGTQENLAEEHFRGIDVSANYMMDVLGGRLRASVNGSYNLKKETTTLPGVDDAQYDCSGIISATCFPQPEWRHTANLNYQSSGIWDAGLRWRYVGGVDYVGDTDELIGSGLSSFSFFDLNASFAISEIISLQAGVNNILDKTPAVVAGVNSSEGNIIPGFHDPLGRYLFTSVTMRF
ncbi:TonB-dependent receptor [Aliidiomarina minuta]|uniref:TonB-dependent receptor n=1 Tax=Aliidiomarina minuta TaxID=880057 RepID=A0A432W5S4_9GAMM|nr:TonB-dependent receptor [Aliidiomarina minuta]RUO25392.1 TonB-dependent receptor [Aliidiomarina minuta]